MLPSTATKTFATVSHKARWGTLLEQDTSPVYTILPARLYGLLTATVKTGVVRTGFCIYWGAKQGHFVNSLLSKCTEWKQRNFELELIFHADARSTNLRFADMLFFCHFITPT